MKLDYNLITFMLMGLSVFVLLTILIVRKVGRRNEDDLYAYSVSDENVEESGQQSNETAGATIWSGTLPNCEVKDNSYLSNVFLRNVAGVENIQVQSNFGKFEFK